MGMDYADGKTDVVYRGNLGYVPGGWGVCRLYSGVKRNAHRNHSVLVVVRCSSHWIGNSCLPFTRLDVGWSSHSGASAMVALGSTWLPNRPHIPGSIPLLFSSIVALFWPLVLHTCSYTLYFGGWRGPIYDSWNFSQNLSHRPPKNTKLSQQSYTSTLTTLVLSAAAKMP